LYHEIFNELDARAVFNDVAAWLEQLPIKAEQ
jgi:alpha-beta hydrolase superfamily lysophospholipase